MLSACGITAYWASQLAPPDGQGDTAELPRLAGELKVSPEDFVVVEVDPSGQRTDAEPFVFAAAFSNNGETEDSACDALDEDVSAAGKEVSLTSQLDALLASLDAQLAEACYTREEIIRRSRELSPRELYSLVVDSIRVSVGPSRSGAGNTATEGRGYWWEKRFPLAQDMPKDQRRLLHFAVRQRYPHMRSVGGPSSVTDDSGADGRRGNVGVEDVHATVDPLHIFLTFLFGESVADTLAQWLQQKSVAAAAEKVPRDTLDSLLRLAGRGVDGRAALPPHSGGQPLSTFSTIFPSFPGAGDSDGGDDGRTLSEKDVRRAFHEAMRRFYGFVRCSVRDGRVTMSCRRPATLTAAHLESEAGRKRRRDGETGEGEGEGEPQDGVSGDGEAAPPPGKRYTHCIIRKYNLDTMEMKALLAKAFDVKEGSVCVAGMKDKRAVTVQRVSVPSVKPLHGAERIPWPSDPLGSYLEIVSTSAGRTLTRPIHLGELRCNCFRITVRQVKQVGESPPMAEGPTTEALLRTRLTRVLTNGFVNYFGQQRFSESVTSVHDHTGVYLFRSQFVKAVRSVFRAHEELYTAFPEKMDARFMPRNSRDCAAMAHALRQTYRMYFSEHALTAADVREESPLWANICEKAICESVPFALRSLWVHAGQSLFFNVGASFAAEALARACREGKRTWERTRKLAQHLYLPMAGYRVEAAKTSGTVLVDDGREGNAREADEGEREGREEDEEERERLVAAAGEHAMAMLRLSREAAFHVRRVAGVPVPGMWRRVFVVPQDASLTIPGDGGHTDAGDGVLTEACLTFALPPSSYATVCLREILGGDG